MNTYLSVLLMIEKDIRVVNYDYVYLHHAIIENKLRKNG